MRTIGAILVVVVLNAQSLFAQQSDKLTLADYLEWEVASAPQMSPDGKQIIYSRSWIDKLNDQRQSSIYIMNADGSRPRKLLDGSSPLWSRDGARIAYTAPGQPSGNQIFIRYMDGDGATTQITRLTTAPGNISWSPDGKWIAFTMQVPNSENSWRVEGQLGQYRPRGATWTAAPRIVDKLDYRQDGQGFTADATQQIFVVPSDGGSPRQITSGEWSASAPEWTPDGRALIYGAGPRVPDAEYIWRESEIYSVDVNSGQIKQLTTRRGPDGSPAISPDGKLIAYTGYDWTTDTWKDAALYVMNSDGSGSRLLLDADRSPQGLIWAPDGSGIYFTTQSEGAQNLNFVTLAGRASKVTTGQHMLTVTDIHTNGTAVGTLTAPKVPSDVVSFKIATATTITTLTDVNADVLHGKKLGDVEEIWYTSLDNYRIQGWIVKPPDFNPSRKYPLMLSIHGGPHSMYNVGFNFAFQEHAANGYLVLYTNPRGSTGYGSAFGNAIKNAYPGKDYDDLMKGVDAVIAKGYVDTLNMFVYGCSGGGVLTAWIVGHTNRFAAASSNCPVINWMSFVGTTDGPTWYQNFEKKPWEDPSEYLRRSPLMYVGNVKTPTMLMTGVNDLRTPISQTEEFYEALKVQKVPTAMIRFNDEWHGTSSKPSNFIRTQLYLREWFKKHSRGTSAAAGGQPDGFDPSLEGTFSIIARDSATGELGMAVQSRTVAVGSRTRGGKGGLAIFAHQAASSPMFSEVGIPLLEAGMSPQQALDFMLRADNGGGTRQVAIIDIKGRTAAWTSPTISEWKGHKCGVNFCAQGNTLTGADVVDAIAKSFESSTGPLAERLVAAIEAGQAAGGDRRGMQSAALLVLRPLALAGFSDIAIDLRVDEHVQPITELKRVLGVFRGR